MKREADCTLVEVMKWHKRVSKMEIPAGKFRHGAGSKFGCQSKRPINLPAAKIGVSRKYGVLLYRMVQYFSPSLIIELGTGSGISTGYLASADRDIPVISVEGDADRSNFARHIVSELKRDNCQFVIEDFTRFLSGFKKPEKPFLVFIDGDHRYQPTMDYFHHFADLADKDSVIIFDDIRWSDEMTKAWKTIRKDPRVRVSIDLFFMGIVFFNPSITPQNLIIKF